MLYKLLLGLLHLTADVVASVFHLYFLLWKLLSRPILDALFGHWTSSYYHYFKAKANGIGRLERLPKHLGFLVAEEDVSYVDLANLVVWAMSAGVSCITLYDHEGTIKKNKETFLKQLAVTNQLPCCNRNLQYVVDADFTLENGHRRKDFVNIKLLCHLDGRPKIAQVTKDICHMIERRLIKSADIDIDFLTQRLQLQDSPHDPDAIVTFGSIYSTFGYLPWHIRLTEIFVLPSHHSISYKDFYHILEQFSKCQQRFGR